MRPLREITAKEENFRIQPEFEVGQHQIQTIKRDFIEPEPVGTYVVCVFRINSYGQDCDGSALAEFVQVDKNGVETGWRSNAHGLYPDSELVVDSPGELWDKSTGIHLYSIMRDDQKRWILEVDFSENFGEDGKFVYDTESFKDAVRQLNDFLNEPMRF